MSKPDDIPQDVWDKAIELEEATYLPNCVEDFAIPVARAIMVAKAEERAGCLADAEKARDENGSGEGEVYISGKIIDAIRKRGEG